MQRDIACLAGLAGLTKLRLTDAHDLWGDVDFRNRNNRRDWALLMPLTQLLELAELHMGGTWHLDPLPRSSLKRSCKKVMRPLPAGEVRRFKKAFSNAKQRQGRCNVKYVYGNKITGTFEIDGRNRAGGSRFSSATHNNFTLS